MQLASGVAPWRSRIERRHLQGAALTVIFVAAAPFVLPAYPLALLTLSLAYGLFAFGLDLSWGRAGVISIGHAAFFGIGAYGVAVAVRYDIPPLFGTLVALLATGILATGIGRTGLHGRALPSTMAVLTLALTLLAEQAARSWLSVTNGSNGIFVPSLGGVVLSYYIVAAVVVVVVSLVWLLLLRGTLGRRITIVRINEQRAEHLGVNPQQTKILAFVLSSLVATIAGALAAPLIGLVSPAVAGILMSTQVLVWLAVGGRGSILGAFLGAAMVTIGQEYLGEAIGSWYLMVLGIAFILVVKFIPGGLAGLVASAVALLLPRRVRPQGAFIFQPRLLSRKESAATQPDSAQPAALSLDLSGVMKSFGPIPVIEDFSLSIPPGQIVCLIGPNGAGKTTLLNLIAGDLPVTAGRIRIGGQDITTWSPHQRARLGLGRLFQIPSIYPDLTPAQNIAVARSEAHRDVDLPPELDRFSSDDAGLALNLPLADQRALELAVTMAWGPQIVLLDEPAAGLSHEDSVHLAHTLRETNRRMGCTLVIVEHDMDIVRQLADRVVVLADGRTLVDGTMDEVAANQSVRDAYLGAV